MQGGRDYRGFRLADLGSNAHGAVRAAPSYEVDEDEDPFGHGEDFSWSPPPRRALVEAEVGGCNDGGAICREVKGHPELRVAGLGSNAHGAVCTEDDAGMAAGAGPPSGQDCCAPPEGEALVARSQEASEGPTRHGAGSGGSLHVRAEGPGARPRALS